MNHHHGDGIHAFTRRPIQRPLRQPGNRFLAVFVKHPEEIAAFAEELFHA
jgi:hypothetical protein